MAVTTIWRDDFVLGSAGSFNNGVQHSNWSCEEGDGTDYGIPGWGNGEWQAYQSGPDVVSVKPDPADPRNGQLVITAIKHAQPVECPNHKGLPPSYKTYTSARVTTKGKRQFAWSTLQDPTHSLFVEARVKLPAPAQGLWPAFWMLPSEPCPIWPEGGEIDIMEAKNDFSHTTSAVHFKGPNGHHCFISKGEHTQLPEKDNFHVFGVEWGRSKIRFYVDDRTLHEVSRTEWSSWYAAKGDPDSPFNKPFYIVLNLAVGGGYPGVAPADCTVEYSTMVLDWIHVYIKGPTAPAPGRSLDLQPAFEVVAFRFTQHTPDSSQLLAEQYFPDPALASMFVSYLPQPYKIILAMEGRTRVKGLPVHEQDKGYGRLWALLAPAGQHCHKRMVGGRVDMPGGNHSAGGVQVAQQIEQWGSSKTEPGGDEHLVAAFLGLDSCSRNIWAYFDREPSRPSCLICACNSSSGHLDEVINHAPQNETTVCKWGPGVVFWSAVANADIPCDYELHWVKG